MDGALQLRYQSFSNERGREQLDELLSRANIRTAQGLSGPFMDICERDFLDEDKIQAIARTLELPAELLALRAKEMMAHQNLRIIELALKRATKKA
jgi:hypothetical protein